jgi:hypothetical protein
MSDTPCFATGKEKIPLSIWIHSDDYHIYRGLPSQMVLEMTAGHGLTVRQALQTLVPQLAQKQGLLIELPWDQSDDLLASLFIHSLLMVGLVKPTPLA